MTAQLPLDANGVDELAARLRAGGIDLIALSFVDNAGIARVKAVPTRRLPAAVRHGVGASPCFETFTCDDRPLVGKYLGGPDGDLRLIPDLDRLVPLAGQTGWALAPATKFTQDGEVFTACQRSFAARQVAAAAELGLELRMAFETEWQVGLPGAGVEFVPAFEGPGYGLSRLSAVADYARELVQVLDRQEIQVEQFHPEYAPGQLELSIEPNDPVAAADDVLLVRHTIRRLTAAHGWRASFAPTAIAGRSGSGAHVHLSVHGKDGPVFSGGPGRHGLRPVGEAFLAGVLRELPALLAIGAGNPASFLRLQPSFWAGAWQCWGRETREAALRFITPSAGQRVSAANAEVKSFDATANPYLVVGGIIAAGLAGVRAELTLPPEITGDPVAMTEDQRAASGVHRLPTSVLAAADALAGSEVLAEALGAPLHDAILTVRRGEAERFAEADPEEIVARTRWLF
ncbi:glutamine synthetase family protein [Crossiella sp. CA-258035]|uniref:glutamine synthetase family protein n=1 Tax=Crossiella sp. CA-258035 TaxID=2981138 RepID=UPI0024BCE78B|nr:glutamine synthetase family protein [Crossiella sp. CA-258035]WHT17942.1 glutamine synthetase family protein [Crossiella sp. CA-258035]